MEDIRDIHIYNQRMTAGIEDKLFFIPYMKQFNQPIIFVDFGCADGEIINYLLTTFPNLTAIGIDSNPEMRKRFLHKNREYVGSRVFMYPSLKEFGRSLKGLNLQDTIKILHLCSVMHEVHHYLTQEELEEFYKDLLDIPFDYIFMRDMYCPYTKELLVSYDNYQKIIEYAK